MCMMCPTKNKTKMSVKKANGSLLCNVSKLTVNVNVNVLFAKTQNLLKNLIKGKINSKLFLSFFNLQKLCYNIDHYRTFPVRQMMRVVESVIQPELQ